MILLVGLGNPGKKYEKTPHNIGAAIIDVVRKNLERDWREDKQLKSLVAKASDHNICLLLPQTFMNNSGEVIYRAMQKFEIPPKNIWIVCDDVNLSVGTVRVRFGGASGGHNGLKSTATYIGPDFWRIRVGVGETQIENLEKFVLQKIKTGEWQKFEKIIDEAAAKILKWIDSGVIKKITWELD